MVILDTSAVVGVAGGATRVSLSNPTTGDAASIDAGDERETLGAFKTRVFEALAAASSSRNPSAEQGKGGNPPSSSTPPSTPRPFQAAPAVMDPDCFTLRLRGVGMIAADDTTPLADTALSGGCVVEVVPKSLPIVPCNYRCAGEKLCMSVSACGKWAVVGTIGYESSRRTEIWNTFEGRCVRVLQEDDNRYARYWVEDIAVSKSLWVVCGTSTPSLRVWDATADTVAWSVYFCGAIRCLALTPDDKRIVVTCVEELTKVLCLNTGHQLCEVRKLDLLSLSPCSTWAAGYKDGTPQASTLVCFELDGSGVKNFVSSAVWKATTVAISPCCCYVAVGSVFNGNDHQVNVWQFDGDFTPGVASPRKFDPFKQCVAMVGHEGPITSISFSGCSKWVVTAAVDKSVRRWDVETGAPLGAITEHTLSAGPTAVSIYSHYVRQRGMVAAVSPCSQWMLYTDGATVRARSALFTGETTAAECDAASPVDDMSSSDYPTLQPSPLYKSVDACHTPPRSLTRTRVVLTCPSL